MKKLLLLTAFCFALHAAQAQETRFGFKAGVNYADINGEDVPKNAHSYKLGWHAGVMLNIQYPGNTWFSIQPELIYSRKGYEASSQDFPGTDATGVQQFTFRQTGAVRFNYIELPVMFTFKTGILVFDIGPQVSYLAGMRDDNAFVLTYPDGSTVNQDIPEEFRITRSQLTKLDVGFATGFRIETVNGASLGLRFNQGLVNLRKNKSDITPVPKAYNQVFQVYVSYLLNN